MPVTYPDVRPAIRLGDPLEKHQRLVRSRFHAIGVKGRRAGGWIKLPHGKNVQGWYAVIHWATRFVYNNADKSRDYGLLEVIEGKRIGVPTIDLTLPPPLSRRPSAEESAALRSYCLRLAAFILNPASSYVRLDDTAREIN